MIIELTKINSSCCGPPLNAFYKLNIRLPTELTNDLPNVSFFRPIRTFSRYIGTITTWYLHFHVTWARMCHSWMVFLRRWPNFGAFLRRKYRLTHRNGNAFYHTGVAGGLLNYKIILLKNGELITKITCKAPDFSLSMNGDGIVVDIWHLIS